MSEPTKTTDRPARDDARGPLALAALAAAALLAGLALAEGALAAFVTAPLGIGLAALAVWLRRGPDPRQARALVAAGLAAVVLGLVWTPLGATWRGLAVLALGAATVGAGARRSLAEARAPEGVPVPAPSLRVHAAVATDEAMRAIWSATALLDPPPQPHAIADALRAAVARHREAGILDDPSRAHAPPPALEKPEIRRMPVRRAGEAEHLLYESEFEPGDPEVRDGYLGAVRNRTAHAYLWRHPDGPRPTLLCLHGYGMGRVAWDVGAWDVRWLHRELGLDVVLPVLPLHGPRALARRSGAGFLDAHPLWTNAAFAQTVWELRRLTGWLRSQGAPAVGVYGMSLGGYTTALFASLERGLACAVPSIPVASLSRLLWRDMPEERRLASEAVGLGQQLLDDAWAPHAPLRHRPRVAPDARLIVAGAVDRITPPDQALALWDHWEQPALHWFPGSHLVPLGRAKTRARLASHLRAHLVRAPGGPGLSHFRAGGGRIGEPDPA